MYSFFYNIQIISKQHFHPTAYVNSITIENTSFNYSRPDTIIVPSRQKHPKCMWEAHYKDFPSTHGQFGSHPISCYSNFLKFTEPTVSFAKFIANIQTTRKRSYCKYKYIIMNVMYKSSYLFDAKISSFASEMIRLTCTIIPLYMNISSAEYLSVQ